MMDSYEEKKRKAVEALAEINPFQPFGTELFNALTRVTISVAIETVALRLGQGLDGLEVLMTQRPNDDPFWPGQWHYPGTILRPGEEFSHAFKRLEKDEFLTPLNDVNFIGPLNFSKTPRGHEVALVFLVKLADVGNIKRGQWYRTDQLPKNTVKHHRENIIPLAISKFGKIQLWTRTEE